MTPATAYLLACVAVLVIVMMMVFFIAPAGKGFTITPLSFLAFLCILAGFIYSANRYWGYRLLGAALVLALVDIFVRNSYRSRRR